MGIIRRLIDIRVDACLNHKLIGLIIPLYLLYPVLFQLGKSMYLKSVFIVFISIFFVGCASVPMESMEKSNLAKQFNPPSEGNAGLYIYRDSGVGTALKKDVKVDGKCIGETAPNVFFYEEVKGGDEYKISTESEFSPNELLVLVEKGKNYFIRQYIKFGLFVGGADLELVEEEEGKKAVQKLNMAKKGNCSE